MGLDLKVLGRHLPGHELEFHHLLVALGVDAGLIARGSAGKEPGFWSRLIGSKNLGLSERQKKTKRDRFLAIQTPAFAALGAPRVGTDPSADAWVSDAALSAGSSQAAAAAAVANARGQAILALLAPNDGLPVYCNSILGTDEISFRGSIVDHCKDVLSDKDRLKIWGIMTAPALRIYGDQLKKRAHRYAEKKGLTAQIGQHNVDWSEVTEPCAQLHIVDCLSRWALFWGSRGHGCFPHF